MARPGQGQRRPDPVVVDRDGLDHDRYLARSPPIHRVTSGCVWWTLSKTITLRPLQDITIHSTPRGVAVEAIVAGDCASDLLGTTTTTPTEFAETIPQGAIVNRTRKLSSPPPGRRRPETKPRCPPWRSRQTITKIKRIRCRQFGYVADRLFASRLTCIPIGQCQSAERCHVRRDRTKLTG